MKETPTDIPNLTGEEKAVMLFTADTNDGRPFHAYIQLTLNKLATFHEAQLKGAPVDLNKLGKVLHTGWGHQPDAKTHEKIKAEYGEPIDSNAPPPKNT